MGISIARRAGLVFSEMLKSPGILKEDCLWDLCGEFAQDLTPLKKEAAQIKNGASAVLEIHVIAS
jgi:hypothetical protein